MSHHHCHSHEHKESCDAHEAGKCPCTCHQDEHHHHEKGEFAHELLELADDAWMEVLYEKIKAKVTTSCGADLDKIADLVVETNGNRWKRKSEKHRAADDYLEKIYNLLHKK